MRERVETTRERKLVARMQPSLAGVRNFLFNLNLLTPPSLSPENERENKNDCDNKQLHSSQDFVTPADQAMENHPAAAATHGNVLTGSRHARSPAAAAPSPLRGFAKRARGSRLAAAAAGGATPGGAGGEESQLQHPAAGPPRGGSSQQLSSSQQQAAALLPALLRGSHRRARSPPVATNVFMPVPAPRPGSPMSSGGSGGAAAAAPPPPLPSPQSLPVVSRYAAEFRELGPLGAGAFSRVVRAAHRLDGREYAVKKSTQELFSPADVARWRQEAQALAAAGTHRGWFFFSLREGGVFQRSFPCFSLPSRESFRDSAILEENRIGLADDHEQQQNKKKNHFAAPILLWRREPRFFNGKKERGGELTLFNEFSLPLVSSENTICRDREVLRRMGGERATRCVFFFVGG